MTTVALLALLGADFGLRATVVLSCNADLSRSAWCLEPINEQQRLNEWVLGNVLHARATDILPVVFTYFLVRVGRGQQNVMSTQAAIAEQQTEILQKQLLSQGPLFGYELYKLEIKRDDPEKTRLRDYRVSLLWRNFGKDIATNVTYWAGSVFEANTDSDPPRRQNMAKEFQDTIFKATALSGHLAVAPGGTVETRLFFLLTISELCIASKYAFFVWCVLGYRSRLQSENWFEEIAIYLEFVLDRDPDSFGLTEKVEEGRLPFGVAIVGYRYRTVDGRSPE